MNSLLFDDAEFLSPCADKISVIIVFFFLFFHFFFLLFTELLASELSPDEEDETEGDIASEEGEEDLTGEEGEGST
jgi:hypothetical protein